MISLILSAMMLSAASAATWCKYDCQSRFPNHMGINNWGSFRSMLPLHRSTGFSPFDAQQLCSTPSTFSELTHPVPMSGSTNPRFAVLCGEGAKVFDVTNDGFELIAEIEVSTEDPGIFLTADFNHVVVTTSRKVTAYEVTVDGVNTVSELVSDSVASAPGHVAGGSLYGYFGTSVHVHKTKDNTVTQIDTGRTNSLSYAIIDGKGNAYFCSANAVVQANLKAQNSNVIDLPGTCSAVLANTQGSLIVSTTDTNGLTSSIYKVNTKTRQVELISDYNFAISGISREAWREPGDREIALLGLHSNLGVHIVFEKDPEHAAGTVRSFFNTSTSLSGRPTMTVLGNPIVFDSEEAFAYTDQNLVKIYSTKHLEPLDSYLAYDFLPNPLFFSNQVLIGFTSDGLAVAYNRCTRFPIGGERPENSCPFSDLEPEPEDTTWLQIGVGAGAFVAFPFLGTTLCKKMKLLGDEEDDHVDVELYSDSEEEDSEDEEEEERYLTPAPINVKRTI